MIETPSPVHKQILKSITINFLGSFGMKMFTFATSLYILQLTGSALGLGGAIIIGPTVSIVSNPFLSYLIDHYHPRKIIIGAQFFSIFSFLIFGVTMTLFPETYYIQILIILIALNLNTMILNLTLSASSIRIVPSTYLHCLNSLNQSTNSLAKILSPILGAFFYSLLPFQWFGILNIGTNLLLIAATMSVNFDYVHKKIHTVQEGVLQTLSSGWKFIKSKPIIFLIIIVTTAVNFFLSALNIGLPVLLINILNFSEAQFGWVESSLGFGMLVSSLIISSLKFRLHPLLVIIRALFAFGMIFITIGLLGFLNVNLPIHVGTFILIYFIIGGLRVTMEVPTRTFMQKFIPENLQGRIFTFSSTVGQLLMPVGTILFSLFFEIGAVTRVFIFTGLFTLLFTFIYQFMVHHYFSEYINPPENNISKK